ncbi:DUF6351 family protein [Nonomuraea deserti]|uniref:DUF6351 family protein n=1 Tax=Nonomuraea deserti TaxID=1848322 RepID=UPI00248323CF|nr:DUF6351 family protein [Nonomuraea deserti]
MTERQVAGNGTTPCNTLYPVWTSPRLVAGSSMAGDIVKCRLRPIDPAEYGTPLTETQLDRLRDLPRRRLRLDRTRGRAAGPRGHLAVVRQALT